MPISAAPNERGWFLETPGSLYAIGLDATGLPAQRYWGPRVPSADWTEILRGDTSPWRSDSSRPDEAQQEVLADGGVRWGVPGLQVVFPGGNQSLELAFVDARISSDRPDESTLVLSLVDSLFAFSVHLHYRVRADSDVIERWVEIESGEDADADVVLLRADSANWFIDEADDYWYSSVNGHWGGETRLERGPLPVGDLTFSSRTGTTSHAANPWIMVHPEDASEDAGVIRTVSLGWSGSWHLTAQRRPEGGLSVTTGFGHEGVRLRLERGRPHTTPPSYGLVTDGGFGETSRKWHAFAVHHLRPAAQELRPVLYNSWEATEFDVSEAHQMRLADKAAAIGAELFVLDDGWFGARTNDRRGLGDWHPNPDRFPNSLHPLADHVRSLGMGFGLWVEPEMVIDSDLYRAHPEWVLHFEGRTRHEARNQLVLNFARDDVKTWALEWLDDLVATHRLDFIKWDMNRSFTQAGWPENSRDQGSLWLRHTRAVYEIMATLRARHPSLRIESCSGGGGRVDFGMMQVVDQFWTSDNTDALDRQTIQHGFSQLYPPIMMCNWVTDSPNPITGRTVPLQYRFHIAMAGALAIGGDLDSWSDAELEEAAEQVALYKEIREVVQLGALHRLGGRPGAGLTAVEYVRGTSVVVLSYEPRRSLERGGRRTALRGLDASASYVDQRTGRRYSGAYLMQRGLVLHDELNTDPGNGTLRFSNRDYLSALTRLTRI